MPPSARRNKPHKPGIDPSISTDDIRRHRRKVQVEGRMAQFLDGELTVEDMDDEELAKGRFRDKNGGFSGRPPAIVPKEFHDACVRRLLQRAEEMTREHFLTAVETFADIASSPAYEPKDRLKAAAYIWERTAGKVPDKVEIKAKLAKWEQDIEGIISEGPVEDK